MKTKLVHTEYELIFRDWDLKKIKYNFLKSQKTVKNLFGGNVKIITHTKFLFLVE